MSLFETVRGWRAPSWLVLVAGLRVEGSLGHPGPWGIPSPLLAAALASAAQDFNKKHIMVSNALSGLH